MKIKTITNKLDNYQIKLSTSNTKNLNFILDDSGAGSTLFDKLHSYFSTGRNDVLDLDLIERKRYDINLMFVEEYLDYHDLLDYFVTMGFTDEFLEISESANQIYTKMLSEHKTAGCGGFLKLENSQIMVPRYLSAPEATLAYYALLIAIRKRYRVDLPLIINRFGRWGLKYCPLVVRTLAEISPQTLIFTSEGNFGVSMHNYRTDKKIPSIHQTIKNKTLGMAYRLDKDGVSEYVPF